MSQDRRIRLARELILRDADPGLLDSVSPGSWLHWRLQGFQWSEREFKYRYVYIYSLWLYFTSSSRILTRLFSGGEDCARLLRKQHRVLLPDILGPQAAGAIRISTLTPTPSLSTLTCSCALISALAITEICYTSLNSLPSHRPRFFSEWPSPVLDETTISMRGRVAQSCVIPLTSILLILVCYNLFTHQSFVHSSLMCLYLHILQCGLFGSGSSTTEFMDHKESNAVTFSPSVLTCHYIKLTLSF